MRAFHRQVTCVLLVTFTVQAVCPPAVLADHFFGRLTRLVQEEYHGTPPDMCDDTCVEQLAENIDWLEHHIDRYGSIVAKQPDIWGEARLTKHRDEYERMMYQELNQFKFSINASLAQSDSSFLAQAFALSAAVDEGSKPATTTTTVVADSKSATSASTGVNAATVSAPDATPFTTIPTLPSTTVGLEPTLFLDQMSRYLQHLQELRRINEGDDTSDAPGYAMNLVRIPVSMLPGKLTREGFGAEITITGTPVLSDDLLPNTFRSLVVNDLVDQLGLPLVKTIENIDTMTEWKVRQQDAAKFNRLLESAQTWNFSNDPEDYKELEELVKPVFESPYIRAAIVAAIESSLDAPIPAWGKIAEMINDPDRRTLVIMNHQQAKEFADFQLPTSLSQR